MFMFIMNTALVDEMRRVPYTLHCIWSIIDFLCYLQRQIFNETSLYIITCFW